MTPELAEHVWEEEELGELWDRRISKVAVKTTTPGGGGDLDIKMLTPRAAPHTWEEEKHKLWSEGFPRTGYSIPGRDGLDRAK